MKTRTRQKPELIPGSLTPRPDLLVITLDDVLRLHEKRGELEFSDGRTTRRLWFEASGNGDGGINFHLYGQPLGHLVIWTTDDLTALVCPTGEHRLSDYKAKKALTDRLFFLWWDASDLYCHSCFYQGETGLNFKQAVNSGNTKTAPLRIRRRFRAAA